MKRLLILVALLASPAHAEDYALVISDKEKKALLEILDIAAKARGIEIAQNVVYFLNKIQAAPVVTEQKPGPAEEPKR